jgi:sterol 3beta-glucosyltransferase
MLHWRPVPQLYGFSSHVLPIPADWPDSVTATGYWFLDQPTTWQPDPLLKQFLADGPAPVYFGFGSMANNDSARATATIVEAIRRADVRAVLATGVGGLTLDTPTPNVFLLKEAPHDWLFPQMAAIVHHGGAGTTGAAFRAGKPQLICPFFGDQPFWGRRVAALGVGPQPIKQKNLTTDQLTEALITLTVDQTLRERADALGAAIRAEDGVAGAVEWINARLGYAATTIQPAPV